MTKGSSLTWIATAVGANAKRGKRPTTLAATFARLDDHFWLGSLLLFLFFLFLLLSLATSFAFSLFALRLEDLLFFLAVRVALSVSFLLASFLLAALLLGSLLLSAFLTLASLLLSALLTLATFLTSVVLSLLILTFLILTLAIVARTRTLVGCLHFGALLLRGCFSLSGTRIVLALVHF